MALEIGKHQSHQCKEVTPQMEKAQKIGIALALYEPKPDHLAIQLKSLQNQTFSNWICIITSDSPIQKILNAPEIQPFKPDSRFIWLENPTRLGHKRNFEKAIQETLKHSVEALACCDQDDDWYPNKLQLSIEALKKVPPLSLVHTNMHSWQKSGLATATVWEIEKRCLTNTNPIQLIHRNLVTGCSMLFDAELAKRYPIIPDAIEFHDHWFALLAAFHGGVYPIDKPLLAYRQHETNQVGVSPFIETSQLLKRISLSQITCKAIANWEKALKLKKALEENGLKLEKCQKLALESRVDLGLRLLAYGARELRRDPALAQAYFKGALGKALS
jgi:hypothetical protein